jgi:hypothetical protein
MSRLSWSFALIFLTKLFTAQLELRPTLLQKWRCIPNYIWYYAHVKGASALAL